MRAIISSAFVILAIGTLLLWYFLRYQRARREQRGVTLVTQWYRTKDARRNAEIDKCIAANHSNPYITRHVYFVPDDQAHLVPQFNHSTEIRPVPERMAFQDAFALNVRDDELVVVANSDIIFTPEATRAIIHKLGANEVFALSRWDCDDATAEAYARAKPFLREDSQDAWCWRGKMSMRDTERIPLGVWGCDNRIAWEFQQIRQVRNPSKSIKLFHLHPSDFRTTPESRRISDPYAYIPAE